MTLSINKITRSVRRRLKEILQKHQDGNYRRRVNAILLLNEGYNVSETAKLVKASRSSIRNWRARYENQGEVGLVPEEPGRPANTVNDKVCTILLELIQKETKDFGYLRSRWTSEMLAEQVYEHIGQFIHSSTVRRLLPTLGIVWNRARPTLCIQDPLKTPKMKAINKALKKANSDNPVFYVDEVDIDFNPRIGNCWMKKGSQTAIPTPGKNQKRYLAGALNTTTGNVVWVEWEKKNSDIFILMMAELRKRYRQAKTITLIADNYIIHKSAKTKCFLEHNEKFKILFQPVYHPWVNKIELLWKQLHDNITRNHRRSEERRVGKECRSRWSPYH